MEKQATAADGERSNDYHNEFYNTGRIGRRNALPDILGCNCTTTTADLPSRLSGLTTKDSQASTSSAASSSSSGAGSSTSAAAMLDRDQPSTSQSCTQNTLQQSSDDDMNQT